MCMVYLCACVTLYCIRIISFGREPIRFCLSSHREIGLYLLTAEKLVGKSAGNAETQEVWMRSALSACAILCGLTEVSRLSELKIQLMCGIGFQWNTQVTIPGLAGP